MLIGFDPILNADILHALLAMGHGDEIVIAERQLSGANRCQAAHPHGSRRLSYSEGRPFRHADDEPRLGITSMLMGIELGAAVECGGAISLVSQGRSLSEHAIAV